jgi:CheY-like chemotaxis protein
MSDQERVPHAENFYRCQHCQGLNDSSTATLCSCITAEPTLSCTSCGKCFCGSPAAWRGQFTASPASAAYLERSHSQREAAPRVTAPVGKGKVIVLVVDDDRLVRLIATRALEDEHLTVVHAADGMTALQMAQTLKPDLVITDALLPQLDGRELSRRIKTDPSLQKTKVVVMTALYKGLRYKTEALRDFLVDDYMEKPVTPEKLRSIVGQMIGICAHPPLSKAS